MTASVAVVGHLFIGYHVADGVAKAGVEGVDVRGENKLESPQRRHLEYLKEDTVNTRTKPIV